MDSRTMNALSAADSPIEKINAAEMGGPAFEHRRGKKAGKKARTTAKTTGKKEPESLGRPTPERLAKGDGTGKTPSGGYRAPPPIERLRDRNMLDATFGYVNEAMYEAALKLEDLFYASGLTGSVGAQDLNRIVTHGGDAAARYMPAGEMQAHKRQQWRQAVKMMGYFEAFPHRGAARVVIDVICYGNSVEAAAAAHCPGGSAAAQRERGMDRLKEGLFTLALLWRMCATPSGFDK